MLPSSSSSEPAEVFIWPRGTYLMEHLLSFEGVLPDIDAGERLVEILDPQQWNETVSYQTFLEACDEAGISEMAAIPVFENASDYQETAPIVQLALDVLLLHLPRQLEGYENRDDAICAFFMSQMERIMKILLKTWKGRTEEKALESLDKFFDAMIDDRPTNVSDIVRTLWHDVKDSFNLGRRLNTCLVPDPFRICDFPMMEENKGRGLRKKTSLAPQGKRVVTVSGWYRLQLLTKDVFRGAHLRISHSQKDPASVFAPSCSLSVIVDTVTNCPCLVLGPCSGTVHLRRLRNSRVTISCRRLIVEDSHDVAIFLSSLHPPHIMFSSKITFAPFNVAFTDLWEEMNVAGMSVELNFLPTISDDQWEAMGESQFYLQPVPFVYTEDDIKKLLSQLPSNYGNAWKKTARHLKGGEETGLRPADIAYLRSKIRE